MAAYLQSHSRIGLHHVTNILDKLSDTGTNLGSADTNDHGLGRLALDSTAALGRSRSILRAQMGALLDTCLCHCEIGKAKSVSKKAGLIKLRVETEVFLSPKNPKRRPRGSTMMRTHLKLFRDREQRNFFQFDRIHQNASSQEAQGRQGGAGTCRG